MKKAILSLLLALAVGSALAGPSPEDAQKPGQGNPGQVGKPGETKPPRPGASALDTAPIESAAAVITRM